MRYVLLVLFSFASLTQCARTAFADDVSTAPSREVVEHVRAKACVQKVDDLFADTCGEGDEDGQAQCVFDMINDCLDGRDI